MGIRVECGTCGHQQDEGRFCGHCGAQVASAAGVRPTTPPATLAGTSTRRSLWTVLAAVLLVLLAIGIGGAALLGGDDPASGPVTLPSTVSPSATTDGASVRPSPLRPRIGSTGPAPVGFADRTHTVLIFDDGYDGALALDLDSGDQQRIDLPGQRAGDQPYRLHRMGGWLVVGWGGITAVAPGTGIPPRSLGDATIFVPAAEPDQLWLIDHASGRVGGEFAATLIDSSGTMLATVAIEDDLEAVRGVPGGLALRRASGSLAVYDVGEGRVRDYLAGEAAWLGDVGRDRVLWCEQDPCFRLRVADGAEALVTAIGDDERFDLRETWLSPDGSLVAAAVTVPIDRTAVDRRLRIYDAVSGTRLADTQLPLGSVYGDWPDDGTQFLAWLSWPGTGADAPALLGRWAGGDAIELVDVSQLGLVGLYSFVTLPREVAAGIFAEGGVGEPCPVSDKSEAMGSLPAWRGDRVHVALPREAPTIRPQQLFVGIPGTGAATSFSVSADRLDGPGLARFSPSSSSSFKVVLEVRSGMRTAAGYPPHWGLALEISDPGCWAITVTGEDGVGDTVVVDLPFDPG